MIAGITPNDANRKTKERRLYQGRENIEIGDGLSHLIKEQEKA